MGKRVRWTFLGSDVFPLRAALGKAPQGSDWIGSRQRSRGRAKGFDAREPQHQGKRLSAEGLARRRFLFGPARTAAAERAVGRRRLRRRRGQTPGASKCAGEARRRAGLSAVPPAAQRTRLDVDQRQPKKSDGHNIAAGATSRPARAHLSIAARAIRHEAEFYAEELAAVGVAALRHFSFRCGAIRAFTIAFCVCRLPFCSILRHSPVILS